MKALFPLTGKAQVIGVTGPLGVGKSSVINLLVRLLREREIRVGVVAVDPSSPFSGGSVLGDRIRIERDPNDAGVYFRSMASRGHSGGVAAATREVVRVLDAAGFGVVLVETVGSGQVDVEIREIATTSVVVLVPHLGDEVQTLKAGLFEIADVFCVNKGDLPGADAATKDLAELVALGRSENGWAPTIVTTSAQDGEGIPELWGAVEAHERFLDASGGRASRERNRFAREIEEVVRDMAGEEVRRSLEKDPELGRLVDEVAARRLDPWTAASRLYRELHLPR
jgi:LAO/AO transport system kinase